MTSPPGAVSTYCGPEGQNFLSGECSASSAERLGCRLIYTYNSTAAVVHQEPGSQVPAGLSLEVVDVSTEPHPPHLSDAVERYALGESVTSIAKDLGIDRHRLSRDLRAAGVVITKAGRNVESRRVDVPVDELVELYNDGISEKALAERYGYSRQVIRRRLLDEGVTIRGRSAAMFARMASTPTDERKRLVEAAHAARRGGPGHNTLGRMAIARGKERTKGVAGKLEMEMQILLHERGLATKHQLAVGTYNIDLASPPFAVEVHVHSTNPLKVPSVKRRAERLMESGWSIIFVWVSPKTRLLVPNAADEVVAWIHRTQLLPSFPGHYRVIRGTGEHVAGGRGDLDQVAVVPAPEGPF